MEQEFNDKLIAAYVDLTKQGDLNIFTEARNYAVTKTPEKYYRRPVSMTDDVFNMVVELSKCFGYSEYNDLKKAADTEYYRVMSEIWAKRREKKNALNKKKEAAGQELLKTVEIGDIVLVQPGNKYRLVIEKDDYGTTGYCLRRSMANTFKKTGYFASNGAKFITRVIKKDFTVLN